MEALFILLISGIFLGTFLPLYANTLKLKSDFRIRNFVSSENFSTLSNIQDADTLELQTSSTNIENTLEQGVMLTYDNSTNSLIASGKTSFLSKEECQLQNSKEKITENFEFINCKQIFLKKIKSATNLYCFSVYSISEFSDGNWNVTKDTGIFNNSVVPKTGSTQLTVANVNLQTNPDTCASY